MFNIVGFQKLLARITLPFFIIFATFQPINDAYAVTMAPPQTTAYAPFYGVAWGAGALGTTSIIGAILAGCSTFVGCVPAATAVIGAGTIATNVWLGYMAFCPILSVFTGADPCTYIPLGKNSAGGNGAMNNNISAYTLPPTSTSGTITYYGFGNGAMLNLGLGMVSTIDVAHTYPVCTALGGTPVAGSSCQNLPINLCYAMGYPYSLCSTSTTTFNANFGTFNMQKATACPSGSTLSNGACFVTNPNAKLAGVTCGTHCAVSVTLPPTNTTQTPQVPTNPATNPVKVITTVNPSDTVTITGTNQNGQITLTSCTYTDSGGASCTVTVNNSNATMSATGFITDANGTVTSYSPTVQYGGQIVISPVDGTGTPQQNSGGAAGGGAAYIPGQINPLGASGVTPVSGVVGSSGSGQQPTVQNPYNPSGGSSGSGSNTTSGSGTGGCVGTLATPCITQDISQSDGSIYVSAVTETTGASSVIYVGSQSAVVNTALYNSFLASMVSATSATSTQLNAYASSLAISPAFMSSYVNTGTSQYDCDQAIWGASGVPPSIAFNINNLTLLTPLPDPCSNQDFMLIPTIFDWFAGLSTIAVLWLGGMSAFTKKSI